MMSEIRGKADSRKSFSACSNERPLFAFGVNLWVGITRWNERIEIK
jgi:hypothetical protein